MIGRWSVENYRNGRTHGRNRAIQGLLVSLILPVLAVLNGCAGLVSANNPGGTPAGVLQLSPTSISFGKIVVGKQSTQSVSVSNTGTGSLNVTSVAVSNQQFAVSGLAMPLSLGAGQSTKFNVTITPSAVGSVTGTLSVSTDASTSPVVIDLSASAVANATPQLSVNPTSLDFGAVSIGQKGTSALVVSNTGSADLTVSMLTLTGASFAVSGITTPATISAGQSVSVTVTFTPTTTANATGSLAIVSNDPSNPTITVPLSGSGSSAATGQLTAAPTSVAFGSIAVGSSSNQSVVITNTGNAAVKISGVTASGTGYAVTGLATPATLNPSASATLTATYTPAATGSATGSITIASNASNSTLTIPLSGIGSAAPTGQLTAAPTSVAFGTIAVGNSSNQSIVIKNTGNAAVKISSVAASGTGYAVAGLTAPATLNPSASATLTATYTPAAAGNASGSITIASDASNSTMTIPLTGSGAQAGLSVSPSTFNFGSVVDGQTKSQTFTITNTGTASLTVAQISASGAAYSVSGLNTPATVAAGATATFSVLFAPTTAGTLAGSISIASNAPNSPNAVSLTGTGVAASVTLSASPTSLTFGNVNAGSNSSKNVTITNSGNSSLTISLITVNAKDFGVSGVTTPVTLNAGQNAVMSVSFQPTASENITGNITVASSSGASAVIPVSGVGVQPGLTATPSSASFGNVTVGSPSSQTIQLTNSGTGTLTITQVSAAGSGFSTSTLSLPISLGATQSTSFNVVFSPASAGAVSGSISIVSNAPNSPATIPLSGTGVAATQTLSFSTTSLAFGNVNAGSSSTQTVTITNTGNANVTISSISETGTGFSLSGAGTPVTLTPDQTLTFSVMFSPTAAGSDSGTVRVTSNATGSPVTISLSGTGVATTPHTVALNWTASTSSGVAGYNVYRSTTSGSGYTKINSALVSGVSYTDSSTLASGTTYYYVTTAVDSSGNESTYSNQTSASIP